MEKDEVSEILEEEFESDEVDDEIVINLKIKEEINLSSS